MTNLHKQITKVTEVILVLLSLSMCGSGSGGGGCSGEGDFDPLNPPTNFWISSLSATSLQLGWSGEYVSAGATLKIERALQGGSFSEVGSVNEYVHSFIDDALDSTKTYVYRIRVIRGEEKSNYSKRISAAYSLSNQILRTVQLQTPPIIGLVTGMSLSPDGRFLTVWDDHLYIWNTSDWSSVGPIGQNIRTIDIFITHESQFIVTGENGIVMGENAKISVRRFPELTVVRTINIDAESFLDLAVTPNGELVAAIDGNRRLMLWDLNNGNFIQLLDSIKDYQGSIAISPDGKTLVECCSEFLKVWDLNQRTIVKKMYGYFSHPIFSNNGTILSVNANSTTNYRTSDWSPLYSLNTYAFGNAFSPGDSIQVIVTGAGYQIRMLRVADGSTIRTISDEGKTIFFIAFLPDGKTFLTVSPDGEVKIRSTFALISQWGEVP